MIPSLLMRDPTHFELTKWIRREHRMNELPPHVPVTT